MISYGASDYNDPGFEMDVNSVSYMQWEKEMEEVESRNGGNSKLYLVVHGHHELKNKKAVESASFCHIVQTRKLELSFCQPCQS